METTPEFAQTLVSSSNPPRGEGTARSVGATIPDTRRPTVLPRLEWSGEQPTFSGDPRDRFEEVGLLGQGGMGEVVLLKDHDIERVVALKRLSASDDLGMVLRFVEEIRTVGRLEHPNIVPVHDVGVDEKGRLFFLMKHLRGETLEAIIEKLQAGDATTHARFNMAARVQVFQAVLHAIAYAHGEGFIHRDLKPANIMVGPFGEVTVMDWGLAKRVRTPEKALPAPDGSEKAPASAASAGSAGARAAAKLQTQAGDLLGTPHYMSPEQARGEHDVLDERSDVYALTVILHELLYLEHYLDGREQVEDVLAGVQQAAPDLSGKKARSLQDAVPAELSWFVLKGMEKDPARRYQSIAEMSEALQRTLSGRVRVQCPITFMKRALQEGVRLVDAHPLAALVGVGVAGAGLLALGAGALFWLLG